MFISFSPEPTVGGRLADDPFQCVPSPGDELNGFSFPKEGSDVERVFEATPVQQEIFKEKIQWATAELPFLTPALSFQTIVNAWHSLASYRKSKSHQPSSGLFICPLVVFVSSFLIHLFLFILKRR